MESHREICHVQFATGGGGGGSAYRTASEVLLAGRREYIRLYCTRYVVASNSWRQLRSCDVN